MKIIYALIFDAILIATASFLLGCERVDYRDALNQDAMPDSCIYESTGSAVPIVCYEEFPLNLADKPCIINSTVPFSGDNYCWYKRMGWVKVIETSDVMLKSREGK